jgi:transcription antitermination factor NusG
MSAIISQTALLVPKQPLPTATIEQHWYAVYTCANHEKRVAGELHTRGVEHFLPLHRSVREWKDRRVTLDLPLFPGYVFAQLALRDKLRVLQVPSVVHLVGFGGQPHPVPSEDIEAIRACMSHGLRIEPHPYLPVGCRVRLKQGPLEGIAGVLVRRKNTHRVVLSISLISSSASVEVDSTDVERIC